MSGRGGSGPGGNSRGRGGKFRKFTRGGGHHFSRDLRPLDADGNEIGMWSGEQRKEDEDEDEDEEEEDDDSDEEENEGDASKAGAAPLSREERKAEKKARKEAAIARAKAASVQVGDMPSSESEEEKGEESGNDMPANPNHSKAARNQTKIARPKDGDEVDAAAAAVKGLKVSAPANRRERESIKAQESRAHYRKLHEAGKTDEAKADLERLQQVRAEREAEAARRQAEKEVKDVQEEERRAKVAAREAKLREKALGTASKKSRK